jgi:hypothetical protein
MLRATWRSGGCCVREGRPLGWQLGGGQHPCTQAKKKKHVLPPHPRRRWPWFVPGLIERARLVLAAGDWEGAGAAVAQLLQADSHNVLGLALAGAGRRAWLGQRAAGRASPLNPLCTPQPSA